ncbi:MAG: hypothetical protein ABFR75_06340 [Acidobacteriota bacterium]
MNTKHMANLPIRSSLTPFYILTFLIAILMAFVSVLGILFRTIVYPSEELIQAFMSNDIVNLFIGLPILLGSVWLTWRGKLIGLLCWPGALFFVVYNYIAYVFAMPLNWVFLLHLALAMFSLYTLIGLVSRIDGKAVKQKLGGVVPEKIAGGVLAGLGLLFFFRVIGVVVNALSTGVLPPEAELAVNISDFFTTPAWIIGGIFLWRRKEFGYVTGLGLLFQGSMLFVGLLIFLLLQPFLTTSPFEVTDFIVVFVMGLICFVPFALFIHGIMAKDNSSAT